MGTNSVSQRRASLEVSQEGEDGEDSGRGVVTDGARSSNRDETGGNIRERREKRGRDHQDSEGETPVRKLSTSRRGRGKGHYTGLSAAKAQLEDYETVSETEVPYSPKPRRSTGRRSRSPVQMGETSEGYETPGGRIKACAREILSDAAKSKNLKGDIRGRINSACRELMSLADSLGESEVVRSLKADNERMRSELEHLRLETKALRKAFSERRQAEPIRAGTETQTLLEELGKLMEVRLGTFQREMFQSLGNMVNARLESVEGRLPPEPIRRPPLAADRRRTLPDQEMDLDMTGHQAEVPSVPRTQRKAGGASQLASPMASSQTAGAPRVAEAPPLRQTQAGQTQTRPVPKPRGKKPQPAIPAPRVPGRQARPSVPPPAPPTPQQEGWSTVVKKGKARAKAPPQPQPQQTQRKVTAPKLVAPTMAAVVVALKPDAQTDYRSVMERATTLKLAELGVDHLNVRRTATGARIIEVPGAQSSQAADNLVDRLRSLVGDVAEVYRPVKKAEIKISGFDESVTPEILKREVAARGRCLEDQVSVGAIRMAANGTGSVTAAKVVVTAGRIVVGWSAARVEALEQLPLRCYRCMGTGHTRPLCPSPVDRGSWCYRCSKPGHMSRDCSASAPWCAICHHAGLKAGHVMGGLACTPPPIRGKEAYAAGPANSAAAAPRNEPENRTDQQRMES
ncbi:uncharacterized protein LOC133516669 [Cydia pomonella]|uniref:uncharacterized protein LOC133516669 n=1 Tax=Cydia pomonella TaxID=82600 RepID=UPI002ADDD57B|nr:uncharacterized protein LOC133516669 [Cydia pomonella]